MKESEKHCQGCGVSRDLRILRKCPICHNVVCRTCGYTRQGKQFCSRSCADYFFFGDPEE